MRTFNLRLILWLAGIFVVTAVVVHFVHDYQVHRNASAFLLRAENAEAIVRKMAKERKASPDQLKEAIEQTVRHYGRYLSLNPDDLSARIQYANFVDDIPDAPAAYFQNEKILRTNIDDADDELRQKVEAVRVRQIQLAIRPLNRLSDAIYHINYLLEHTRKDDPELLELRGRCETSREDSRASNANAQQSFEKVIELAPHRVSAYAFLAGLQRDRQKQPQLAEETLKKMIAANPDSADAYAFRAQFHHLDKDLPKQPETVRKDIMQRAIADCQKARQLDPKNANVLRTYAKCLETAALDLPKPDERIAYFTQARDLLNEVIADKPLAAQLYLDLSNLELRIGQEQATSDAGTASLAAAIAAIRRGIEAMTAITLSQPDATFDLRWRLADLLAGDKDPDKQKEVSALLAQLKLEQPDLPLLLFLDGRLLVGEQKWLQAKKVLEEARRRLEPSDMVNRANRLLGICYSQLGDQDLRLEIAQQAVNQRPLDVAARLELAETLISLNRSSEALQQFQDIVQLRPPTADILKRYTFLVLAATVREDQGRRQWEDVTRLIDMVAKGNPDDPWVPIMRAEVCVSQEDLTGAEKLLEEARQQHPNQFTFGNALVELAQQRQDYDKATQRLDELQQQFGDTPDVRSARARLLIKKEGADGVPKLVELTADLDKFPANEQFQFYWQLARICLALGDAKEGLRYGQEAAKLIPNSLRLRLFLLDVARTGKDIQAAQQLVAEIEKLEGNGPVTLYAAAMLDLIRYQVENADTLGAARQKLADAAQQRKKWSDIPVLQGIIAAVQGDQKRAIEYYKQAIALGNLNTSIVFQVVRSLYGESKLTEADGLVRKVQEQRSGLPLEMGRLASRINFSREDYDRALELAESLPRESNAIKDALWVGYLQLVKKEYQEAETSLQNVVGLQPDLVEAWLMLVRCLKEAGKESEAEAKMQEAVTKVNVELQPYVRSECLKLLGRPDEAVTNYREAIKANPDAVPVLKPAVELFMTSSETRPEAESLLERFVKGELDADEPVLQWARRNLARLLGGRKHADQRRAIDLVKANLAETPDSIEDLQLQSRLLAASPQLAERIEALSILQRLDRDGEALDSDCRYLLAKQCRADGDWNSYSEQMIRLISDAKDTPSEKLYMSEYINALLDHGDTSEAMNLATKFHNMWGEEITAALVMAKVQAAGASPQPAAALATVKKAVDDPNVSPTDKAEKLAYAVTGLNMIVRQLNGCLAQLRADVQASSGTDADKNPGPSGETLAARTEIAKRIETQIIPVKTTIEDYIKQIVGEDPQLQLLWVPYLVNEGKKKEAIELIQQHWQEAKFDLLLNALGTLINQTEIETADRGTVEQLLTEAVKKSEGKPNELLPLLQVQAGYYVTWARYDEAIVCYQQIMTLADSDLMTLNNLAMLMASQKKDLPTALAAINKAVDLVGPVVTYLDTQGMVLLAAGQKAEALETMRRVVEEQPRLTKELSPKLAEKWGSYHFHLALAFQANGDLKNAGEEMNTAEALGFTKESVFKPEWDLYDALKKALQ